jgi:hypothetical protein
VVLAISCHTPNIRKALTMSNSPRVTAVLLAAAAAASVGIGLASAGPAVADTHRSAADNSATNTAAPRPALRRDNDPRFVLEIERLVRRFDHDRVVAKAAAPAN